MKYMVEKKRVVIIAHFCDYAMENTNNRFNYLATLLYKKGYEVELITSSFSHRDKRQRTQIKNKKTYKMTLIYESPYKRNVSLKRLCVSHKIFSKNLERYLHKMKKPDLIYCAFPSIDAAECASRYANKNSVPFVLDIQDLWPEAFRMAFNVPVISNLLFRPMNKKADRIYNRADEIIAVSQSYVDRAVSVSKKVTEGHAIYLGTDLEEFDDFAKKDTIDLPYKGNDEKWIAYCGTLGKSYDLCSVIDALALLKNKSLKLVVMGDGPRRKEFEQYAIKKKINCMFMGKLAYSEMCGVLKVCDITVNPIVGKSVASIINKHADYAASGLPVVNTQNSLEYRQLIKEYKMGVNCLNGDAMDIALKINGLVEDDSQCIVMGKNARKCAEEKFNRKDTYQEIIKIIEKHL